MPFGSVGIWEVVLILAVLLLVFGAKRLPEIGSALGKGIREFKGSIKDIEGEISRPADRDRELPRYDANRQDALRHDAPRQEAPRHDAPREEAPRHDAPRHDAPRHESTRPESPRVESYDPAPVAPRDEDR
jgi:TatA/E family protein of Tat protein translocase